MEKEQKSMNEQKKDEKEVQEVTLENLLGAILTTNVELTKEEYNELLKRLGLKPIDTEKTDSTERLNRIKSNFYGSIANILLNENGQLKVVAEELMAQRAILMEICKKNGIDVSKVKTSQDKMNEAVEKALKKQSNFKKVK